MIIGDPVLYAQISQTAVQLYKEASVHAHSKGIILADTKFEFGLVVSLEAGAPQLILIDELLTPDSSRYWPLEGYEAGKAQPSFDKQPLRDYLASLKATSRWNGEAPPPSLPAEVVDSTSRRYLEAYRLLTGHELSEDL